MKIPTRITRSVIAACSLLIVLFYSVAPLRAQYSAYELYSKQFQNRAGVADTATERLLAQRQAIRAGYDAQALEGPVNPAMYKLGPGDGVYLNVYAAHSLDQDLTVTPEGRLLIPRTGQIEVAGLTVTEAEKKLDQLLAKDYKNPNASLSLRKLRGIKVNLLGEVVMPGVQTATELQRLSEVIDKSGGFKQKSSLRNIEIHNTDGSMRTTGDLVKYFSTGDLSANPYVEGGDVIMVPTMTRYVQIYGSIASPGQVEYHDGDKLSTVIKLARGLLPSAQADSVEVSRFDANNVSAARRFYVNYQGGQDVELKEGDAIFVRAIPEYHIPRIVTIGGEVRYPGKYSIDLGQTKLSDVMNRAGGVLTTAGLEDAVLIRRAGIGSWESEPEYIRLQQLGAANREHMTEDEYNYYVTRSRQLARSVMVVDFKRLVLEHDASQDILLRDEDSIWVPRARGYVNVSGSVNNQGNIPFMEGATFRDYIEHAGGMTSTADKSEIRIINSRTSSYIDPASDKNYKIEPGDTIVVPAEKHDFWKNFETTSAIIAQVITIVAGILLLTKK